MSKKLLLLSFFFLNSTFIILYSELCVSQNLVPNSSFEQYDNCPDNFSQVYYATGWSININTGDYYNGCSSNNDVSVPLNALGFQYPADTNCSAYCGIITYIEFNPGSEEIIGRALSSPLVVGQKYYASFKANFADGTNINCAINKLGIKFTNVFYGDTITIPSQFVNNFAHIYSDNVITDKYNWTLITGSFIADSTYHYILIGRFFDNNHTDTIKYNNMNCFSYYYIDDICVSTDSSFCYNYSYSCGEGITNYKENNIEISPNPVNSLLHISTENIRDYSLKVYNVIGALVLQLGKLNNDTDIDLSQYPEGIYFLQIIFENKFLNKKLIIN